MKKAPIEDRQAYWKYMTAMNAFLQVEAACDFLLRQDVDKEHPLFYPMMIALHTLYGRPFKQKKPMRLSENLVPKCYARHHANLIQMRDKIFAHVDFDDVKTDEDAPLNKVVVSVRTDGAHPFVTFVFPRNVSVQKIKALATELRQKTAYHAEKIWKRHIQGTVLSPGDYEVNLSEADDSFLTPLQL